jgi:ketosteroid isomerase-like protein
MRYLLALIIGLLCIGAHAADVAQYKAELMAADRAFAAESMTQGKIVAFLDWVGEDATMFREGKPPVEGKTAIREFIQGWQAGTLDWHPVKADAAASGDLGYTWGEYTARGKDKEGKSYEVSGRYVSVWKRDAAGQWKWVVDIGS